MLAVKNKSLVLSYKYVGTGITKRDILLEVKDFAEKVNDDEFIVKCRDDKYHFKVKFGLFRRWAWPTPGSTGSTKASDSTTIYELIL